MKMKITSFFFVFFLLLSICANAQEDYCAKYLEWTLECCHKGELEQAKRWYEVYKDLGGAPKESIEKLLQEIPTNSTVSTEPTNSTLSLLPPKDKTYRVGDVIMVDTTIYTVAYVRDHGKHGLAISNKGWGNIHSAFEFYVTQQHLPTEEELDQIYKNRDKLRLYNVYWTRTESSGKYFYTKDFSTGTKKSKYYDDNKAIILLIHRF